MAGVHEIDDAHVGLRSMFAVQSTCVLLQCAFPRNRHCQNQSVERGMVESFTDQFAGRKQYAWGIGCQCIEFCDQGGTLFF